MKDYEYGFDASSGSGYANVARPEEAKEDWRLHRWGFGGGNERGFAHGNGRGLGRGNGRGLGRGNGRGLGRGNGRGLGRGNGRGLGRGNGRGFGPSKRGAYRGQAGHLGPRTVRMAPPPSHFQKLILGEQKGRCWGIPGSPPQGQVHVQDVSVAEYCSSPPPQQQQQHQQLGGFSERIHAMHSIPISQAQVRGSAGGVGGIGRVGVGMGVPAPLSTLSFPLDTTRYYLLGQLEYYLSPQNMAQDFYLRKQVGLLLFYFYFYFYFLFFDGFFSFAFIPSF
jgi:la-related protein 1